jgi:hypothetical protein
MTKSTGPILAAGALTWANQTILSDDSPAENTLDVTVRLGIATAMLAGILYGIEKVSPNVATALAYTALVTTLLVRINGKPTPLERALDVIVDNPAVNLPRRNP